MPKLILKKSTKKMILTKPATKQMRVKPHPVAPNPRRTA